MSKKAETFRLDVVLYVITGGQDQSGPPQEFQVRDLLSFSLGEDIRFPKNKMPDLIIRCRSHLQTQFPHLADVQGPNGMGHDEWLSQQIRKNKGRSEIDVRPFFLAD